MNFITEDSKLAVKKGAFWMDENHPGWANRINLDELSMESCDSCIIGQAVMETGYWGVIEDNSPTFRIADSISWAIEHGFDASGAGIDWFNADVNDLSDAARQRYMDLETLWTDEVRKRLGGEG